MTIDAVVAQVDFAAHKPFSRWKLPVEHAGPGSEPVELARDLCPKSFGILNGVAIKGLVLLQTLYMRLRGKLGGRRKDSVFAQDRTQVGINRAGFHFFSILFNDCYEINLAQDIARIVLEHCTHTGTSLKPQILRLCSNDYPAISPSGSAADATPTRCARCRRVGCISVSNRVRFRFLPRWRSKQRDRRPCGVTARRVSGGRLPGGPTPLPAAP